MGQPAKSEQHAFRLRNDDGSEIAATWLAVEDANATMDTDTNYRVRFALRNTGGESGSYIVKLQYQNTTQATGWLDVNGSSSHVRSTASSEFTEADPTTDHTPDAIALDGNSFVAGEMDETDGAVASVTLVNDTEQTDHEWCFQIRAVDVVDADSIQLRMVETDNTAMGTYTATPTITVNEVAAATEVDVTLGQVTVTPYNVDVIIGVDVTTPAVTATPYNFDVVEGIEVDVAPGSVVVTPYNFEVLTDVTIDVDVGLGSVVVTPYNFDVVIGVDVTLGQVTATPYNFDVIEGIEVDVTLEQVTVTPYNINIVEGIEVDVTAPAVTVTPYNFDIVEGIEVDVTLGQVTVTPHNFDINTEAASAGAFSIFESPIILAS